MAKQKDAVAESHQIACPPLFVLIIVREPVLNIRLHTQFVTLFYLFFIKRHLTLSDCWIRADAPSQPQDKRFDILVLGDIRMELHFHKNMLPPHF